MKNSDFIGPVQPKKVFSKMISGGIDGINIDNLAVLEEINLINNIISDYNYGIGKFKEIIQEIPEEFDSELLTKELTKYYVLYDDLENVYEKCKQLKEQLNLSNVELTPPYSDSKNFSSIFSDYAKINYKKILEDGYTPQGVTKIGDNLLISCYNDEADYCEWSDKKQKWVPHKPSSRIYMYNCLTGEYEGKIILDNSAHVGGITYNKDNKILFVAGSKGKVNAYDYGAIQSDIDNQNAQHQTTGFTIDLNDSNNKKAYKYTSSIKVPENFKVQRASTIYYYDDRIYIGTYTKLFKGQFVSYKVNIDERKITIDKASEITGKLGYATQGIAVTEYNGKKYMITTHNRRASTFCDVVTGGADSDNYWGKSYIIVDELNDDGSLSQVGKEVDINKSGIEGINIDSNNSIVIVFEYVSSDSEDIDDEKKVSKTVTTDMETLIEKCENGESLL